MPDPMRVYVSHHHSPEEDAFTMRLVADLKAAGATVWDDIFQENDFLLQINRGLGLGQNLVVVITPAAITSPWVQRVLAAAHSWKTGWLLRVFLVMMTPVATRDIPPDWRDWNILDATKDYEGARHQLLQVLGLSPSAGLPPASTGEVEAEAVEAKHGGQAVREKYGPEFYSRIGKKGGKAVKEKLGPTFYAEIGKKGSEAVEEETPGQPPLPYTHEHVAFTSHYPREVAPQVWDRLLVFIALDNDTAAAQVEAMAAERLQQRRGEYRTANADATIPLQRRTRLTIVPRLPGFLFDPASITTAWIDDVQCYEFRLRADGAAPGLAVNGQIAILEGPLLRGEIPLSVFVRAGRQPPLGSGHFIDTRAAAYRNTFPSYSRKDEPIVRACETVVESGGDRFLRDVRTLRAGEEWAPKLLELIEQATVFQLFWSKNAAQSQQVEREWRHALSLLPNRPHFIRPLYWTPKPYPIPSELQPINLGHLEPETLGLTRPSWRSRMMRRES